MKFKRGDKVEITRNINGGKFKTGQIVKVNKLCKDHYELISSDGESWYYSEIEICVARKNGWDAEEN